jgi:alpha-tubulin suppressor-like RCC1 family protein
VSCGFIHTLAISSNGRTYSWGSGDNGFSFSVFFRFFLFPQKSLNRSGRLGHGDMNPRASPTLIESLRSTQVVDIAAGKNFSVCVTSNGRVFSWGSNQFGALGTMDRLDHSALTPTAIQFPNNESIVRSLFLFFF